jgi:Rhodopirellula transposase DDE domain
MALVEPEVAGSPSTGERWVRTSLRGLSAALGRRACPTTIARLLRANGYGLRGHRKRLTGPGHPDRDAQFRYIATQRRAFVGGLNPRISIDAKKRELVGDFKNPGRRWGRAATDVNAHDFPDRAVCRATPYGVFDPELNRGHVCIGTSGNTADLAVDAVRDWWRQKGKRQYKDATALLIEADGGGSNGSKSRRFKLRLQEFADEAGLAVTVCHYPPGASKWNPIEHRLFSQISATWAGIVLSTVAVLVGLIRRTTTATGLTVTARVMAGEYPTGLTVTAAEFNAIRLTRHETCPQWNYTIHPRTRERNTT